MKKAMFALIVLSLSLGACEKESSEPNNGGSTSNNHTPACELNDYGWISVENNTSDPYRIFIDGEEYQVVCSGCTTESIQVDEGNVEILFVQGSGFVFFPTEYESSFYLEHCESFEIDIP